MKDFSMRLFNHQIDWREFDLITKDELLSVLEPSVFNGNKHDSKRVAVIDSIRSVVVRFYNQREDSVHRCIRTMNLLNDHLRQFSRKSGRRYQYHGGNNGRIEGYFTENDGFYMVSIRNNEPVEIDSIPDWNLAHFLCDYLNSDEITKEFMNWVDSDTLNDTQFRELLSESFSSSASK